MMRLFLLTCALAIGVTNAVVSFTGDAYADFTTMPAAKHAVMIADARPGRETSCGGKPCVDVDVSRQFCTATGCAISGWDIRYLFFQYDGDSDSLLIGVDCFGVCGDADGDGFADSTSPALLALRGADLADLSGSEGVAIALDFNMDVANVFPTTDVRLAAPFDYIIGVPAAQPANGPPLPCTAGVAPASAQYLSASLCFGLYDYDVRGDVVIGGRFKRPTLNGDGQPWPVRNENPQPSVNRPDWEFTINNVAGLRERAGNPPADRLDQWTMLVQAWAGSLADASIGEDVVPSLLDYSEVNFPCLAMDACDVCHGDSSSCLDCNGVPNGPATYDACGVCNGDSSSCKDCAGVPHGNAHYDACGVCNGDDSTCADCAGVPHGNVRYDACDVCGGDDSTCVDCMGEPNGAAIYDRCDVCNGDSNTCLDCKGIPNGPATYDECGVCGGTGATCADCNGVPNGPAAYDICGVCNGNGTLCLDCEGMPSGHAVYDVCGVCGGDDSSCADCAGVPNGDSAYDACDVCRGDSTTCLDCAGVPFGNATLDVCGVCGGDGGSCVCNALHRVPLGEADHALAEYSLHATRAAVERALRVLRANVASLKQYDPADGTLAADIVEYLDASNDFRAVLREYVYVLEFFQRTISDFALAQ